MKRNQVALAVASACLVMAAPAFALPASDYALDPTQTELTGTTLNIRISGATAVDPGIFASALFLCDPAVSIHRYSVQNNAVLFCQIDPAKLSVAGKTNIAVYKHSIGGSGGGVQNVNQGTAIAFIDLNDVAIASNCNAGANVTTNQDLDGTNPLPPFVDILCAGASNNAATTTPAASYIGVSDVEPAFFGAALGAYDNLDNGALTTVLFGAPVTVNVYKALQRAQNLVTGFGGTCALDDQTEVCMPTLSISQLVTMYTQSTAPTWPGLTGATILNADDVTPATNQNIFVSRRVNTSGTQKTYEALIARTSNTSIGGRVCQPSVDGFVSGPNANSNTEATTLCSSGTNRIVRNSGSNQVLVCMREHDNANRGSIGVLSLEYKTSTVGERVRFTKINGITPNYRGVARGEYDWYGDVSLNLRVAARGVGLPTLTTVGYTEYITALRNNFANPATVEIINGSAQPFGGSGLMALDVLAVPIPVADFTGATARNPWSRLVGGTTLNNCQPGKAARP